jgi:hypothetical protein
MRTAARQRLTTRHRGSRKTSRQLITRTCDDRRSVIRAWSDRGRWFPVRAPHRHQREPMTDHGGQRESASSTGTRKRNTLTGTEGNALTSGTGRGKVHENFRSEEDGRFIALLRLHHF